MEYNVFISTYYWLILAISIVLVTIVLLFIENKIYCFFKLRTQKTNNSWDDAVVTALHTPLRILIFVLGVVYALSPVAAHYIKLEPLYNILSPIKLVGLNLVILWFCIGFIREIEQVLFKKAKSRRKFNKTTIRASAQVATIFVTILIVLNIINPIFGVPISALLAFGGIGGIAVALACQDLLANIFGGFYIYLDRPFDIGDWISSPDKDIEGVVEDIGLRLIKIRTFEKRARYIPNSMF